MPKKSTKQKVLTLCPDDGSPWGLWCGNPPSPAHQGGHLAPEHFYLSKSLTKRLEAWLELWRENYADAPEEESHTWKRGFDQYWWVQEGDAISASLEEEVHGYVVDRRYRTYLASPTR